ncbi:MAG: putative manganese-dependent inorganic diphosphatase [Clostridia bacterium]|nr:putative manganese-dependent inorganic diphosphatase [Clostridia bacterium]
MSTGTVAGKRIYVVGHRNPDCDSVVSAIAYAHVKNEQAGDSTAIPTRIGSVNHETAFVLNEFGFEPPLFLPNAYAQVKDVIFDAPMAVRQGTTLLEVWSAMQEKRTATSCVVDEDGRLAGVVTIGDVARAELNGSIARSRYLLPVINIAQTLSGRILVEGPTQCGGNVVVGDGRFRDLVEAIAAGDLLIVGNREDVQAAALECGVSAAIITGGAMASEHILWLARDRGAAVISTPYDTFTCLRLLWQAVPIDQVMTRDALRSFGQDDLVLEVKEEMRTHPYKLYPVMDEHGRPAGLLGRNHLIDPPRKQFILVDHNERSQSIDGLEHAQVLEVIDHHRIGTIETDQPILFVNRPWGSTATIVSSVARQQSAALRPELAGLMCSAIISDTLAFKSPTSTRHDLEEAQILAGIAGIDLGSLSLRILEAKCNVDDANPDEILRSDFKEFTVSKSKVGIGQATTYGGFTDSLKGELIRVMRHLLEDAGYGLVALMLTDVVSEGSEMLWVARDLGLVERAFGVAAGTSSFFLAGVVSRKQQVVPEVMRAIREGERA